MVASSFLQIIDNEMNRKKKFRMAEIEKVQNKQSAVLRKLHVRSRAIIHHIDSRTLFRKDNAYDHNPPIADRNFYKMDIALRRFQHHR